MLGGMTAGCTASLSSIATGTIDFIDPLAANWEIEGKHQSYDKVLISLNMKRYYTGGAGEAHVLGIRRAKELMRCGGFEGYEVLAYSESIDSSLYGSKRTAEMLIRLTGEITD